LQRITVQLIIVFQTSTDFTEWYAAVRRSLLETDLGTYSKAAWRKSTPRKAPNSIPVNFSSITGVTTEWWPAMLKITN